MRDSVTRKRRCGKAKSSCSLLAHAGVGIGSYDLAGNILLLNKKAAEHSRGVPEDFVGKSALDIFGQELGQTILDRVSAVSTSNETQVFEDEVEIPSGRKWFLSVYNGIVDGNGNTTGVQIISNDITERKRAEEVLRHQKEILQTILDSVPVMIAFLDREGHHQLVNHCWQSTLGWSLEEAIYKDVLAELYPDPAYREYVLDYIKKAAGSWGDFKTRTRDGCVLDTSWVNVPLSDGSNIGIGIDITERKQAEEALRQAEENFRRSLDDSPLGVRIVTAEGETIYANRAILDIYGYDSIEELRTTPVKKRYTPESYAEFQIRKEKRQRGE